MRRNVVVTGTDTGIGKTVFAAGLTAVLGAHYWKPVQAGTAGETDSETVARLSGLQSSYILPEAYRLALPASPHLAARQDGVVIDPAGLSLPQVDGPMVIEGAGGVLVPLAGTLLSADMFALWAAPVILCARTSLGTINHSLLTVEALRARSIPILGIVFIGEAHEENEHIIPLLARVPSLGRLPWLRPLTDATLASAMLDAIDITAIRASL
jgi:dethiobiotin synthetase